MEVRAGGIGVTGMADAGDDLAALDLLALVEAGLVGRQMRVIIDPVVVARPFVKRDCAKRIVEQFLDRAVGRGDDRGALAGHDVDRVVAPRSA